MPEEEHLALQLLARNARWAALAVSAVESRDLLGTALAAPGDLAAFVPAAVATLEFNVIAEGLADPDCTELAAERLTACLRAAAALPAVVRDVEAIRQVVRDLRDADRRIAALTLRHRATRADNVGRPGEGWRLREQALPQAPPGSYLEAVLLIELNRTAEARRVLDRLGLPDPVVMAELNIRAGRPDVAREFLARAAVLPPEPTWSELGRRAEIALALRETATADELAGRAIAAFERVPPANDYYRALAADHVAVAGLYNVAVRARLALGDVGGAFELADRVRAAAAQPGRSRAIRGAEARMGATHERLAKAALRGDEPRPADVVAEVVSAEAEVDRAAAGRPVARPGGADLEEVRRSLPDNAALLFYQSFDQELFVWAVRRDEVVRHHANTSRRDLARAVRELHSACADPAVAGDRVADLAGRLAADLIEPVASALTGVERLYVAPPGNLMLLPFAVLPLNRVPLGELFVLSVLPSAALLTRRWSSPRNGTALLVGDPHYAELPRLPGTGVEVRAIARRLPGALVLDGAAATSEAFTRHAPGRAIIHLATHGAVDELRPYLSELALTGHDRITLPDLAALDLDGSLLVLSACHTGRGRATAGGDVLGLARAALAAGVRHVVVSLWPVDDISACLLMTTMYRRLAHGHDVPAALACAARRLRAMDDGQRRAAYERLGGASEPGRVRDLGPARTGVPAAHWASFIHVGA
ncbi:CHAT domain-containing protein [Paractinoplanes lichenicola]|uniref:CHAT domain-containing protein n=1 Tax=Paractinoplanes lichenicola TaxID=2802976 RepID=A0ABS1VUB4_9ACTN|nr:CHAT domain-containing protein [Actinoplanes lichenicola]MBL7258045.1 CHAT domain-containing protein [Actinoplanes lichenicola]